MKKLGAILFVIVLILGLPFVAGAEQQVETVNITGVDFLGSWDPEPSPTILNDWGSNPDGSRARYREGDNIITVNLEEPKAGPYTAINVKLRVSSAFNQNDNVLTVKIYAGGAPIGDDWYLPLPENQDPNDFAEYSNEWLNMTAEDLANLQVEIEITEYYNGWLQFSAIQVELVSEGTDPIPEVTDPIHVNIDYRPYRNSNPLNYRSRGKVRVVIFGSADFDVRQIDRESVLLEGVAPVRDRIRKIYSRTDGARDDYEDLVLMFKTQQLIKALEKSLEQELQNGGDVFLNLTGNLKDDGATPIEGQDMAVVFGKRHKHKKKGNWKNYWKWWKHKKHQHEDD